MANTYTSLHYHVVFSTKNRERWIQERFEQRIWAYLGGIARENNMNPLLIGGVEDHVHLLLGLPPVLALSNAIKLIKGGSSKWIKETFPDLTRFSWQDSYAAFTASKSHLPELINYIRNQRPHHHRKSFAEEYRALLDRHEIQYDERYVFDGELVG
jgi:REP element-mobilizing transposase RayT